MKERILFIFLLFSISAFSQEKASMGTIKLTAIVPDSLLNMKVLHYAQELKYVDKDAQQDTYDAASFFIINSINSKDLKIDTMTKSIFIYFFYCIRYINNFLSCGRIID